MKIVEHCSNITASFCDLTDVWEVLPETYIPRVDGFRGNTMLVSCISDFFLATHGEFISAYHFHHHHQDHHYLLSRDIGRSAEVSETQGYVYQLALPLRGSGPVKCLLLGGLVFLSKKWDDNLSFASDSSLPV